MRELRAERQWTQDKLATKARVDKSTVIAIELGRSPGSPLVRVRLARAFELPVNLVFPDQAAEAAS